MWIALLGLLIGIVIGFVLPISIPAAYSSYLSLAVLAALDSILGGVCADAEKRFDFGVFITGFLGNSVLAAGLAYIGDRLDVPLYMAAVFAFGLRLFANFAKLRRIALHTWRQRRTMGERNED